MATNASLSIHFRDGTSRTISQPVVQDDNISYDQLINSLNYLQEQSNRILTTFIDEEKAKSNHSLSAASTRSSKDGETTNGNTESKADGSNEEEEEEEEDDGNCSPNKRLKT